MLVREIMRRVTLNVHTINMHAEEPCKLRCIPCSLWTREHVQNADGARFCNLPPDNLRAEFGSGRGDHERWCRKSRIDRESGRCLPVKAT